MLKSTLTILAVLCCVVAGAQIITTVAGHNVNTFYNGGPATTCQLPFDAGNISVTGGPTLLFASYDRNSVHAIDLSTRYMTRVAGNGYPGTSGIGGPAINAQITGPELAVRDASGNIYVLIGTAHAILKINASGTLSKFAGTPGTSGFSGDNGPATAATLNHPRSITVDDTGNVYIADQGNYRIRKVNTSGVITTIAGSGMAGFSGDGGLATSAKFVPNFLAVDRAGNIFFTDNAPTINNIRKIDASGIITSITDTSTGRYSGDGGPASVANLRDPWGIVLDTSGNIIVCDRGNHRVRLISSATGNINTIAGTGVQGNDGDGGPASAAKLSAPGSVGLGAGGIYVYSGNLIRRFNMTSITTVAGTTNFTGDGGSATAALLQYPQDVATDAAGNVYIADSGTNSVRRVNASGVITTIAGTGMAGFSGDNGAATAAALDHPMAVAVKGTVLYVADYGNNRVRRIDLSTNQISTVAGSGSAGYSGDGGAATSAQLSKPDGLAFDTSGKLYISEAGNSIVRKVDLATGIITTYAGSGVAGFSGDGSSAVSASLNMPARIAFNRSTNDLYIADMANNRIRMVSAATGVISTFWGTGTPGDAGDGGDATAAQLANPTGITISEYGEVYVTSRGKIKHVPTGGRPVSVDGGAAALGVSPDNTTLATSAFNVLGGITLDASQNLFIADPLNNSVRASRLALISVPAIQKDAGVFSIVPSPNTGLFMVTGIFISSKPGVVHLSVFDISGRLVYSQEATASGRQFESSVNLQGDARPGLYICRLTFDGGVISLPFVISR